jgi:hypothetical protein
VSTNWLTHGFALQQQVLLLLGLRVRLRRLLLLQQGQCAAQLVCAADKGSQADCIEPLHPLHASRSQLQQDTDTGCEKCSRTQTHLPE